ncbi:transcriptional regulator [Calothrix sp. NIES-4071]|nr:transcriptional regulator [Calothrix sp. NIES-4071]BAZ55628.1 transcriptional regulator [Calothrix sp. NIES-4105]
MLTNTDLKSILIFQQELYVSCNVEAFSKKIISILPKVIPSELTIWSITNFYEPRLSFVTYPNVVSYEELAKTTQLYFYEHPIAQYYLRTGDGKAHKISDFLSENQLYYLEGLYQKHLRPLCMEDQMVLVVKNYNETSTKSGVSINQEQSEIVVSLHRPKRDFCERDRLILNLLCPHLLVAYHNATALTQMEQELAQLSRTADELGTIILNNDFKIQLITKRASQLLIHYFQVSLHDKNYLPENLLRWVKHHVSLLQQTNEFYQPRLPLQVEQEGKKLLVRLIPKQQAEQYLLLLEEQILHSLSAELLELLGLTKREAEVLFWITQDKSDKEIASILNLSTGTVKKHTEHIYKKLGVQTRIAAVMYAIKSLGMLNYQ